MHRRHFLSLTTTIAGGLCFSKAVAADTLSEDPLRAHRVAALELRSFPLRWPRLVGRNAKLGIHGTGPTITAVILRTDQGATGWGAVESSRKEVEQLRDLIAGQPLNSLFAAGKGILKPELKPLDIALHDLAGVILKMPVWKMLGSNQPKLYPVYSGMVYFDDLDPEEKPAGIDQVLRNCAEDHKLGYRQLKIKIGRGNKWMPPEEGLKRDIEVVRAVAGAFKDCEVLVDGNDGFTVEMFIRFLEGIDGIPLYWIEEPFVEEEPAWRKVHQWVHANGRAKTLLADGEQHNDFPLLERLEAAGILDVRLTDIVGYGFTRWRALMPDLIRKKIMASPHAWGSGLKTVYAAHLVGGLGNGCTIEGVTSRSDEVDFGSNKIVNGKFQLSDEPGFGLKLRS